MCISASGLLKPEEIIKFNVAIATTGTLEKIILVKPNMENVLRVVAYSYF